MPRAALRVVATGFRGCGADFSQQNLKQKKFAAVAGLEPASLMLTFTVRYCQQPVTHHALPTGRHGTASLFIGSRVQSHSIKRKRKPAVPKEKDRGRKPLALAGLVAVLANLRFCCHGGSRTRCPFQTLRAALSRSGGASWQAIQRPQPQALPIAAGGGYVVARCTSANSLVRPWRACCS